MVGLVHLGHTLASEERLDMDLIAREELKEKLDRDDNLKLVMVLGDWGFRAKHIPGSLNIPAPELAADLLDPEDEIVVYCSGDPCSCQQVRVRHSDATRVQACTPVRRRHRGLGRSRLSDRGGLARLSCPCRFWTSR